MNEEQKKDGWEDSGRGNGTYSHKDRYGIYTLEETESGKKLIKDHSGAYNGWQEYDPAKHGAK